MRRRHFFLTIALAVFALTVPSAVPARSAPNAPIVIGLSIALTGEISDAAGYLRQGYLLWEKDVNAKGGLLGRQVQLKIYDDQSDPQVSARLYEKLITQDKVDLVIGPYSSAVTSAASTVAEKYKMAMLAAGASAPGIWTRGYKYIFQVPPSARNYFRGTVDIAKAQKYKSIAFIGEDSDYPRDSLAGTTEFAEQSGMKVVYKELYPPKTSEFGSYLQHVKDSKPDVLINAAYTPEDVALIHEMKGQDVNVPQLVLGVGASLPDWPKNAGADGDYAMAATQWSASANTPGNKQFVAEFTQAYGRPPEYRAAQAYGAGLLLQMAVQKAKSLDQNKLRDTIAALDVQTMFNRFKVNDTGAQVGASLFIVQWQKGKQQIVWPFNVATAKYQLPVPAWNKR